MIKVVAIQNVKEDCLEQFLKLAREIVEKTNELDEGCISYSLCQDIDDPLHCAMIEEWESKEKLDLHMQAAHFTEIVPQLRECCTPTGGINLYNKLF